MEKHVKYYNKEKKVYVWNEFEYKDFDDMIFGMLDWCGCGSPDNVVKEIMRVLQHIDDLKELVFNKKMSSEEWDKKGKEQFGNFEYILYYIFDEKKLTLHGGSVPGWLTDKGYEMLELMKSYYLK